MNYEPVLVYALDEQQNPVFLGYSIKGVNKLQTTNLYGEDEKDKLQAQLDRLNRSVNLDKYWPNPRDPEVVALLNDPFFMPLEMAPQRVIDEAKSYLVYKKDQEVDRYGNPVYSLTGQPVLVDSPDLDWEASVLSYKMVNLPVESSRATLRIKQACEQIAQKRAAEAKTKKL